VSRCSRRDGCARKAVFAKFGNSIVVMLGLILVEFRNELAGVLD